METSTSVVPEPELGQQAAKPDSSKSGTDEMMKMNLVEQRAERQTLSLCC